METVGGQEGIGQNKPGAGREGREAGINETRLPSMIHSHRGHISRSFGDE